MHLQSSFYVLVSHCALNANCCLLRYFSFLLYFLFSIIFVFQKACPVIGGTTWQKRGKKVLQESERSHEQKLMIITVIIN